MAKKQETPLNTVLIGMAIGLGVFFFIYVTKDESMGMRIGSSLLATAVTTVAALGMLTLIRKLKKK